MPCERMHCAVLELGRQLLCLLSRRRSGASGVQRPARLRSCLDFGRVEIGKRLALLNLYGPAAVGLGEVRDPVDRMHKA